ncbi:MAG: HIT domain-containing protein [Phormidesmis sp.]
MDWYCKHVIHGNLSVKRVYESEQLLAFHHTTPFFEHHVVVIPKQHISSLAEAEAANPALAIELMSVLHKLAVDFSTQWGGCHVGTNVGSYQSARHLHWYIHSGKRIRDRDGNPLP